MAFLGVMALLLLTSAAVSPSITSLSFIRCMNESKQLDLQMSGPHSQVFHVQVCV